MFLWELLSFLGTILTMTLYWKFPHVILNSEFLGDERVRNVGASDGLTAVERYNLRRWEEYRAEHPDFEELEIDDVVIDQA